jgi:hypothetical protein
LPTRRSGLPFAESALCIFLTNVQKKGKWRHIMSIALPEQPGLSPVASPDRITDDTAETPALPDERRKAAREAAMQLLAAGLIKNEEVPIWEEKIIVGIPSEERRASRLKTVPTLLNLAKAFSTRLRGVITV